MNHKDMKWKGIIFVISIIFILILYTATPADENTNQGITILNPKAHPTLGGNWTVYFNTTGSGTLEINDHSFPEEVGFVGLYRKEGIAWIPVSVKIDDDLIQAHWSYPEGKAVFKVKTTGKHTLEFKFGSTVYAENQVNLVSIYDFSTGAGVDKWAYKGETAVDPTEGPDITGQTEVTDYTLIESSNDIRDSYGPAAPGRRPYFHFKFTIAEAPSDITQLDILFEGYSSTGDIVNLKIWNFTAAAWDEVASLAIASDTNLTATITTGITNYIDASGYLHLFVQDEDNQGTLYCDYVYVNVYIPPITYDFWNLTDYTTGAVIQDGTNLTRSDRVNASAHWNATGGIDTALVEHNGTGAFVNYTIPKPYTNNWTNYTLDLSSTSEFQKAGLVNVTTIYANNTYGKINHTSPAHWFYLWSNASVNESIAVPSLIYTGTSTTLYCKIVDSYSFYPIEGYNVSFYNSTDLLGSRMTNSSGLANLSYTDNTQDPPQTGLTYNLTCNITNQPSLFYNISLDNSGNITIQAVNLDVNAGVLSTPVIFGENVTLIANVTDNATTMNRVWANITYITNISDNTLETDTIDLNFTQSFTSLKHEYGGNYTTKRSGLHDVTIFVDAGTRNASNTTSFDVTFGSSTMEFIFPNYRVLANQSFNITINVTPIDGDLWEANLTLNITNRYQINITTSEWTKTGYNLTNGTTITVKWEAESKEEGYTRVLLNVTPKNGTTTKDSAPFIVLLPNLKTQPSTINITSNTTLRAEVVGNVTPVNYVNFTVEKPYSGGVETTGSSFTGAIEESKCMEVGPSVKNVALLTRGGNATCSGEDCNLSIDGDTDTAWLGEGVGTWLNVTFNATYAIDSLEFSWKGLLGDANAGIYYLKNGDWEPLLLNQTPPSNKNLTVYSEFTPFETEKMKINVSSFGVLVLYEFRAITVEERVDKCYVYEYNYTNTNLSGTYTVNTSVHTQNVTRNNGTFLVNFGQPQISIDMLSVIIKDKNETYEATFTAYNGDLRNLTLNLTIVNMTVLNKTVDENWTKNISEILSGESKSVNWTVNGTGVGKTNTTVFVNSTTGEGSSNSSTKEIEVILQDTEAPVINNFWFEYRGNETNKTNLRTSFSVLGNITDNEWVRSVKANITYPDSSSINGTMSLYSGSGKDGIWKFTFESNPENLVLNQTSNYTIRIIAIDIADNETVSQSKNFTVNNTYTLNLTTDYSVYNRGEGITIQVWDVNDNPVEDLNWTVNLTKYNQNKTTIYNNTNTTYTYLINESDPVGNYTLFANVSKLGNRGNNTWEFNVSTSLDIQILDPPANKVYSRSTRIDNPRVKVYNLRNTSLGTANVTIDCLNASLTPDTFNLSFGACFVGAYSFPCNEVRCYSPNSYATVFNITIDATDYYNNTGTESLLLKTESEPPGGGGGGGVVSEVIIEVAPPTCGTTSEERELLFQSSENFELVRGLNDTFPIKVTNPCPNSTLENVILGVEGYLAQYIELIPDRVDSIEYNETKNFDVFIVAPIYMKKGTYPLDFTVAGNASYYNYPTAISKITGNVTSYKNISIEIIETRTVPIFVHEIRKEDAIAALAQAEEDLKNMQRVGFSATRISKILDDAKKALEQGDYEKTKELGEQIADIKQAAFITHDLIKGLRDKIRDAEEERGLKVIEAKKLFNLALVAFEREDYATAQQRIKDAQLVYSLETKGKINIIKLILDYWWAVSLGIAFTSVTGVVSYQRFTVRMIARKLESLYAEEETIMELVKETQKRYYKEKTMNATTYNETMDEYEKRLAEIQGTKAKLRAKRVGMVKISDELENLKRENDSLDALIKKAKYSYFKDRSMNPSTYQKSMEQYRQIKAEIEGNIAMLEAKLAKEKNTRIYEKD